MRAFPPVYSPVRGRTLLRALLHIPRGNHGSEAVVTSARFPGRRLLLTDSGTGALTLALRHTAASATSPLVALPAYCCPDVASAAIGAGCRIALYDTEPQSLSPDWESVQRCLTAGATHLLVTHLFGRIVDVDIARDLAHHFGVVLVEDAAQGAGGSRNGVPAGALADIAVLSFGRGKGCNAGGGGALSVSSAEWTARWATAWPGLPSRGRLATGAGVFAAAAAECLSRPSLYAWPSRLPMLGLGQTVYVPPRPVHRAGAAARVLIDDALALAPVLLAERQAVEAWYYRELGRWPQRLVRVPAADERSGALRFPVRMPPQVAQPLRTFGVARSYPRTLRDYPEVSPFLLNADAALPGADELARTLHTLPTHRLLQERDRRALVDALAGAFDALG